MHSNEVLVLTSICEVLTTPWHSAHGLEFLSWLAHVHVCGELKQESCCIFPLHGLSSMYPFGLASPLFTWMANLDSNLGWLNLRCLKNATGSHDPSVNVLPMILFKALDFRWPGFLQ